MAQANRSIEVGTGLFVLLGLATLGFLTTQLPGSGLQLTRPEASYTVQAKFGRHRWIESGCSGDDGGCERNGKVDSIHLETF